MKITIDGTVLIAALIIGLPGFLLVWWQTSFLTAVGVSLLAMATGIRRTHDSE